MKSQADGELLRQLKFPEPIHSCESLALYETHVWALCVASVFSEMCNDMPKKLLPEILMDLIKQKPDLTFNFLQIRWCNSFSAYHHCPGL